MAFWNKFCGFIAVFFLSVLFSSGQTAHYIKISGTETFQKPGLSFNSVYNSYNKRALNFSRPFAIIPQNYYIQHFGIMCKKELAIEKATKIPFKFRLGSVQQCNYLEGKK